MYLYPNISTLNNTICLNVKFINDQVTGFHFYCIYSSCSGILFFFVFFLSHVSYYICIVFISLSFLLSGANQTLWTMNRPQWLITDSTAKLHTRLRAGKAAEERSLSVVRIPNTVADSIPPSWWSTFSLFVKHSYMWCNHGHFCRTYEWPLCLAVFTLSIVMEGPGARGNAIKD